MLKDPHIGFPPQQPLNVNDARSQEEWNAYHRRLHRTLVVVIVLESDKERREEVKWWGDIHRGIITQILVGTSRTYIAQ